MDNLCDYRQWCEEHGYFGRRQATSVMIDLDIQTLEKDMIDRYMLWWRDFWYKNFMDV